MEQVLLWSHHILLIGGAICVILLFFVLVGILSIVRKTSRLVSDVKRTHQVLTQAVFSPLRKVQEWFLED